MSARDRLKSANASFMNESFKVNAVDHTINEINHRTVEEKPTDEPSEEIVEKGETSAKKSGRPAKWTEPSKITSIKFTKELRQKIDVASIMYGGSITNYITTLIEKDLAENYEFYSKQKELLQSFSKR